MSPSMSSAVGYPNPYSTAPGSHNVAGMLNHGTNAPSPLSTAYRNATMSASMGPSNTSALDNVTSTWLGTDDLLDQYMQSILPIFNDFDHATNNNMINGIGGGGGVGVPISDAGR